ncbi:hypothetical protein PWT90_00916 [Aphanocladium album]|nr:hypothetical protein PWT90_00916 [Aphanocladium album]
MAGTRSQSQPSPKTERKSASPSAMRQTRMRSRIAGAAPLMKGLDDTGLPKEALPEDPEHIPFDQVLRRVPRPKIILHCRSSATPEKAAVHRRRTIHRGAEREPKTKPAASWREYNYRMTTENFLAALYLSNSVAGSAGVRVGRDRRENVPPRNGMRAMLPRLYTDF